MLRVYEIFEVLPNGSTQRVTVISGLDSAKARLRNSGPRLAISFPPFRTLPTPSDPSESKLDGGGIWQYAPSNYAAEHSQNLSPALKEGQYQNARLETGHYAPGL